MKCPKCAAPLQKIPLSDGIDIESCPHCSGLFYDGDEIAIDLAFENLQPGAHACPKCGTALQTGALYSGRLSLERCPSCCGLWFDAGEVQVLRMLSGREGILKNKSAPQAPPEPAPQPPSEGEAMAGAVDEPAYLSQAAGKAAKVFVPDSAEMDNKDELTSPVMTWSDLDYNHFQTSWPVVVAVLGEFPWKVSLGEKGKARDFIHPPYLLSEDTTDKESNWSHGTYLEPEEVWAAFKLEGAPPARSGVAPAQPNAHEASRQAMGGPFKFAAAACAVLFALALMLAQRKHVFSGSYTYPTMSPEKSFVTDVFTIDGRTSNLRVELESNINNGWAFFPMALINEDTGDAIDFAREVSFYSGIDDGEYWSEGSRKDVAYLPSVKPGRYYLRVEPESSGVSLGYAIKLTRDVPQWSLLFWALLLLSGPFLLVWVRWWLFESSRWHESDHPWVTSDGDDEDDDE